MIALHLGEYETIHHSWLMKDAFENGIGVKAPNDALRQTPRIADSTADPLLNAGRSNPWHIGVGIRHGCAHGMGSWNLEAPGALRRATPPL